MPDSLLTRKLRGPMAAWGVTDLLLRQIDLRLAGANWQRGGGKGQRPKPIDLPNDSRGRGSEPPKMKAPAGDLAQRMQNLGLIPPGAAS